MPVTPEKPDYVAMYEVATGRECWRRKRLGSSWWTGKTVEDLRSVPGLESAQWRADVMDGLLAKGYVIRFWLDPVDGDCRAEICTYDSEKPFGEILSMEFAPTLNSALCAAVKAWKEAKK